MAPQKNPDPQKDPALYRIQFKGRFDSSWSDWFHHLSLSVVHNHGDAVTTLFGFLDDQTALHNVLSRIRDLGLTLLLVERMDQPTKTLL